MFSDLLWWLFAFLLGGAMYNFILIIFNSIAMSRAAKHKSFAGYIFAGVLLNSILYYGAYVGHKRNPTSSINAEIEYLVFALLFLAITVPIAIRNYKRSGDDTHKETEPDPASSENTAIENEEQPERPTVEENDVSTNLDSTDSAISAEKAPEMNQPPAFCRFCGKELPTGTKFCRFCGAQVDVTETLSDMHDGVINSAVVNELPIEETKQIEITSKQIAVLDFSALPPKLRRAFIFIEDEEWDRASTYLEKILDEEPENAFAYFGRALVECKIDKLFDPTDEEAKAISASRSFARAMKFADPATREIFNQWIRTK